MALPSRRFPHGKSLTTSATTSVTAIFESTVAHIYVKFRADVVVGTDREKEREKRERKRER